MAVGANPWFRMYSEFAHDPKVQMMSEGMQRRLMMVFCLKCSGELETLHETELAFHLRITETELQETKQLFIAKGFITEKWQLCNWEKRQPASSHSTSRVKRFRDKQKKARNADETLHETDETLHETSCNGLDKKRTEEKREEKPKVAVAPAFRLPEWISDAAWRGYEEMRVKMRCPMTDRGRAGIVRELDALRRLGHPPDAVLDQSTMRSWRGVFELKDKGGRNGAVSQNQPSAARQRGSNTRANINAAIARAVAARSRSPDGADAGAVPQSGIARGDAGHVPRAVAGDGQHLRNADIPGRVIEGYP